MPSYKTIKAVAKGEYKEMKSKFLSFAYPISSPEQVKGLVDTLKAEYFDARHHCFAWRLDESAVEDDKNIALCRTNDDREPNNTAGVPILSAIDSNELKNILIVVVRYFGGIKLGASNLAKAYRYAAQDAIDNSEIITQTPQAKITFSFDFSVMGAVNKFLKDNNFTKENYTYVSANSIELVFDKDLSEQMLAKLNAIYGINILNE